MEQVITVRIIDRAQTLNGKPFGVLADDVEHEVIVTDSPNEDALARAIGKGVLAARGVSWTAKGSPVTVPNISVIGPAFSDAPPLLRRKLDS